MLILLPVLILAAAELVLRFAGYSEGYPLFIRVEDRTDFFVANPEVGSRYFLHPSPPNILADYFHNVTPDSSLRIVVQGGSTAAGFPYYYGGTFPHILEARLQASLPNHVVQVLNTGMAAVNSFTVLDLSNEILALRPNAVLIYAGHNEYYGALGVGSTERLPGGATFVRAYLRLQRLRLVQLLKRGLGTVGSAGNPDEGRMQQLAGRQSIPLHSSEYQEGIEQYRSNLTRLLDLYAKHDIPVFVGTLVSNERDQPPFVSSQGVQTDTARWASMWKSAQRAADEGNWDSASDHYKRLADLDTLSAAAHYGRAVALERTGELPAAQAGYVKAKELDALRFRAPAAMNDVMRDLARRPGVHLVDVQRTFRDSQPDGIIGRRLMADHLHPTAEGYFMMADAFYEALLRNETIIRGPRKYVDRRSAREHMLLTRLDSLVGAYHIHDLMQAWPFTLTGAAMDDAFADSLDPIAQLAQRLYRRQMTWSEANAHLITYLERSGERDEALRAARSRLQELPHVFESYVTAARQYARNGEFEQAARVLESAIRLEDRPEGHLMLADVFRRLGRRDEALRHVRRAAELHAAAASP